MGIIPQKLLLSVSVHALKQGYLKKLREKILCEERTLVKYGLGFRGMQSSCSSSLTRRKGVGSAVGSLSPVDVPEVASRTLVAPLTTTPTSRNVSVFYFARAMLVYQTLFPLVILPCKTADLRDGIVTHTIHSFA